jgi:tetratricopeptide (TPR) repeat protein
VESKVDQLKKMLDQRGMEILFARVASNLLYKGNTKEALKICESGIKKVPVYAQGHYVMARCYEQEGMQKQAQAEYERVIKYDPNHLKAIKRLAELYQENGMEEQSKASYSKLQLLNPIDQQLDESDSKSADPKADDKSTAELSVDEHPESKITDPLDTDKIDLTQFDNVEDDFTTIIQGKKEEEQKSDEEDDISLSLGTSTEELATDTDMNNRVAYEEEIRLRDERDVSDGEAKKEYEDLDELKFDDDSENPEKEEHEDWAMPTTENEATEIVFRTEKSKSESEDTPAKPDASGTTDSTRSKIVTQTLGEILVSQKKYVEALRVFETLQEQNPDNKNITKKVDFLKKIVTLEQK